MGRFEFQPDSDGTLSVESAVFQALGRASTCWESLEGTGIFQSEDAQEVGEVLIEKIHADLGPPGPRLGMATTRELLEELECRMRLAFQPSWEMTGFGRACATSLRLFPPEELNYKTVDS